MTPNPPQPMQPMDSPSPTDVPPPRPRSTHSNLLPLWARATPSPGGIRRRESGPLRRASRGRSRHLTANDHRPRPRASHRRERPDNTLICTTLGTADNRSPDGRFPPELYIYVLSGLLALGFPSSHHRPASHPPPAGTRSGATVVGVPTGVVRPGGCRSVSAQAQPTALTSLSPPGPAGATRSGCLPLRPRLSAVASLRPPARPAWRSGQHPKTQPRAALTRRTSCPSSPARRTGYPGRG